MSRSSIATMLKVPRPIVSCLRVQTILRLPYRKTDPEESKTPDNTKLAPYVRYIAWFLGLATHPYVVDELLNFISSMSRLVALCLAGCFLLDQSDLEKIKEQVAEEILPLRPSFWFHIGLDLPKETDLSVPRVHYDEIVGPIGKYDDPSISFF